ncbi:15402_t:CDS:2 [Funneliformis caledonium]|uniref:15402_t:CDS:1 n=1 Tax=Funneliformis caledonium TaxID=1117310 RepID=A0A9N8WQG5_9GLOM|nr:15402_t:CDS:2 [Funneliformis caledonium]
MRNCSKNIDCNCHPVGLVTGVPGIGKSRLLIECVNHIRKSFPGFLKDLVDLIIVSYNNGNTPSDLNLQLGAEKSLSLQLLHFAFVNPSRKYIEFVVNLKREGFKYDITFREAISILCKGLNIRSIDKWLLVVSIDDPNSWKCHLSIHCDRPDGKNDGYYNKCYLLMETCKEFRISLADVGEWPFKEDVLPAVKTYVYRRYSEGADPFAVKFIEDVILQTPVCRNQLIDDTVNSSTTYGDLESRAGVLLIKQNDADIVTMPFLLLEWLSAKSKCLKNPAIALLRKMLVNGGGKNISNQSQLTWQEFVALFESVKTMLLCQREKEFAFYSDNEPTTINLSDYFNVKRRFLPDIVLPQDVKVYKSMEQFPRKKHITDSRTGKTLNWKCETSPMIINGNSAEFADIFTIRRIGEQCLNEERH